MNTNGHNQRISDSPFWRDLWKTYRRAPSIALCRVPELEYASTLSLAGMTLDHCCGDGLFAKMGWPSATFSAGCDLNKVSLKDAARLNRHKQLDLCDAGKHLPYRDEYFDLVFDNSALEHIPDLHQSLSEIARVLKPQGIFAFNVLNHRYFEWWPMDEESRHAYREWQPFYHALSIEQWSKELSAVGLEIEDLRGYFNEEAARILALLDYEFSGYHIKHRPSKLVTDYHSIFGGERRKWRLRMSELNWQTDPDAGAGYFITARRL
ncbi:MAG TPA: class I SAM-dependent methyltransferase [Pyrinomonadaceae bacterium]|nr:class I SAM-dependent methyltransferase [Pyrinomonadaceae bacterium]